MKERGISQRVSKITSLDTSKSNILDALNYSSELLGSENLSISKVIKLNKMKKYRELVERIKPVAQSFALLKESHKELLSHLEKLDEEVNQKISRTVSALKLGKVLQVDINESKFKCMVVDAILEKSAEFVGEGDSVLVALEKAKSRQ